jgi:hypothetical protein
VKRQLRRVSVDQPGMVGGVQLVRIAAGIRDSVAAQIARHAMTGMSLLDDAQPCEEILVFRAGTGRKAQIAHTLPVKDHAQAAPVAAARVQRAKVQFLSAGDDRPQAKAICRHVTVVVIDKAGIVSPHPVQAALEFLRQPKVVRIKKSEVAASRALQRQLTRRRGTAIAARPINILAA